MSIHIRAKPGEIAPFVLMPGDPRRATAIAETFLENPVLYSDVRGAIGYTGTYKGKRASVQTSMMGQPALAIYTNELVKEYGVETIIRIGTAGAVKHGISCGDIVIARSAKTDSGMNKIRFDGYDFKPMANHDLLSGAINYATRNGISFHEGVLFSSDFFYDPISGKKNYSVEATKDDKNVLAVEMETSELYTLGSSLLLRFKALSICVISDNLTNGERMTEEERVNSFKIPTEIALSLL